ncbi:uncharacterized protein STEHIDRAFT_52710, partial [Stereum hirsutum FP-91666 SS1]|uniref:uncharacterized protein n=1 Tax=Stereum hirsutum (strain FP-91666) TaxID=721885 RepID=UPI000440B01D
MDEKGCQRGGGRKLQKTKYFVPRGRRPRYKLRSANLELFTLIECISADGKSIPPGFVFAGKEFMPEWFVDDISVATSETGWTDDFLCAEWFKKSFIPSATKHRVSDAPILLI